MDESYIQITSGRGPVECCRVVVLVMQKLVEHFKQHGLEVELIEYEDGPHFLKNVLIFASEIE